MPPDDDPFGPPIRRPAARPIHIDKPEEEPEPAGPSVEPLWPDGAPGALGDTEADRPALEVWPLDKERLTGTGVVLCPGGGYDHLATGHEGGVVAEWLGSLGITAFLLRYRVAPRYRQPAPLQDARRAVRLARYRAQEWLVDPRRIGIMGFSAGGHLAAITAPRWNEGNQGAEDPIDRISSRPDFLILVYPVIT
ncbi:MAG: alpha/beta hydrolase, partial [bacterium]